MVSTIQSGARVLVTGATGYLGAAVAEQFIQEGYIVVGSARTPSKAENVKSFFDKKYGSGKFEIYASGDLEKVGAFDDAVKDVEAIVHVASPVGVSSDDPIKDVVEVAIKGTTSLLNSAQKYGQNVKSVVVVSSVASVLDSSVPEEYVYDEKNWNDGALKTVIELKEKGKAISPFIAYMASKNEAERAVWKFKEDNKPSFTLSTVLPTYLYGAIVPTPRSIGDVHAASTANYIVKYYTGENQDYKQVLPPVGFVSIVDVARASILIIEKNDVSDGQRYLLNAGPYSFQQIVDIMRKNFPERQSIIVKGEPGNYEKANLPKQYDGSKITRDLGLKYTDLEPVILATINSAKEVLQ
ncbi:hypothetical protein BC943DRAFT_316310 [Umbelopsis sp. AD052]|nr:hypothetical protein BC943DRAFT_316310 [Umbelopsis sp. AD052]